ncbi:unnamed protein product [Triticum turgidum subsp. durum]|uniref:Uncharacterized protein n=1 Tax=Triticum turgidum subsp. durum TaxID=4567 RepID=A0A9R1A8V0_TRITD|nr:unnamed protein product [Triticum turgidum subsp. durum]
MDTAEAAWGVASLRLGSRRLGSRSSYRERGADVFSRASSAAGAGSEDDEEALMWAALERLPTHSRVRKGFVVGDDGSGVELGLIDVAALGYQERTRLLDRLVRVAEEDHEHFLRRLKQRIDRWLPLACLLCSALLCIHLSAVVVYLASISLLHSEIFEVFHLS